MASNENAELEDLIRNSLGNQPAATAIEPDAEAEGGGLDLATLVMVVRKSLPWMLLFVLLGLLASWTYLRYTKPVYRSSSILKIDEKQEAGSLGLGANIAGGESGLTLNKLSGEVELIKSNLIYRQLRDSLELDVNYYAQGTVLESELYKTSPFHVEYVIADPSLYGIRFNVQFVDKNRFTLSYALRGEEFAGEYTVGTSIAKPGISLTLTVNPQGGTDIIGGKYHFVINNNGAINQYIDQNLTVEIINPDASTIGISFADHNPRKAQDIVNRIDTVYLVEKLAKNSLGQQQTLQYLDEQLEVTRDSLQKAELALQRFVKANKTYDVKSDVGTLTGKLDEQEKERLALQQRLDLLNGVSRLVQREQLTRDENTTVEQSIPGLVTLQDPVLTQQINELNMAQQDLRRVLRSNTEATEAVQQRKAAVEYAQRNVQDALQQSLRVVRDQMAVINQQRGQFNAALQVLPQRETELARLRRPFELFEKTYLMLMDKKVEFSIAKAGTTPDFQILSPASAPLEPISPVRMIVYAIGLAGGIVLGLGLVAVRYFMHNTITSSRELENNCIAPVLGIIPTYDKEKLAVSKLIVDKNPKSAISESIRSIRTNLEFMASSKKKRLISITSTVSGEGKTFVAVNLGGIIALSEQRVVILDLDMRKPKVNLAFGAENIKGISTILIERHSWEECIQHTSIPTLDFISAGPTPPNPSELILSPKFDELLANLHQQYDVIMIDTPPVGLVTDGILIMRKADLPIYIVRANYSKKAFLKNINKLIRTNGFTRLATILNDAQASGMYGYGYGYGYGQGYGQGYYEEVQPKLSVWRRLRQRFA
ncbi:GumC family protein [Hymenobacter sp. DG25B]|uniref:GumC family protein n=1 Tax=Hymenobacter sp. DG25B TaxID=1385664 RepID=UPI0006623CB0|nr:polysaccharide biosynthesis tyrosine autokinase [Hymenobacter sp. DG25B]